MAGIWFPTNNTSGQLSAPEITGVTATDGFYSNREFYFYAKIYLKASTSTQSVPLLDFSTGTSAGSTAFRTRVFVENGILKFEGIDHGTGYRRAGAETTVPLSTEQINEVVITVNPYRNMSSEQVMIFINGVQQATVNQAASRNYIPWSNYQRVHLGGYDDGSSVATGLLVLDFLLTNKWSNSTTLPTTSTSFDLTIWRSDFEDSASPLTINQFKNNSTSAYQWLNTDELTVIWTAGNEPPSAGGGGQIGGIIIPGNGSTTQVQGSITENDLPVARRVFAITEAELTIDGSQETTQAVLANAISSEIDGSYTLDTSPYEGTVFIIAADDYGTVWQPDTAYAVGDVIRPPTFQGYVYHCTLAGTSSSSEPVWWLDTGSSQSIGTAQFQAKPFSRPLAHGPILPTIVPSA